MSRLQSMHFIFSSNLTHDVFSYYAQSTTGCSIYCIVIIDRDNEETAGFTISFVSII